MAILRLTNYFYTESKEYSNIPIPEFGGASSNVLVYSTKFPFVYDKELAIYRSLRNSDMSIDSEGNLSFDGDNDFFYQSYLDIDPNNPKSGDQWFVCLAINGNVVYDGLSSSNLLGDKTYANSSYGIIKTGILNGIGYAWVDQSIWQPGLLDSVEIALKSASTHSPWIYYGNIPERQTLAKTQFGLEHASGMGGIPESLTPSQAVDYRYRVDMSLATDFTPIFIPFPSAFLIGNPIGSASALMSTAYFMGDVLDGNGNLAVRSNVSFILSSLSLNSSLFGGAYSVQNFNIITSQAYKTINSRELEYNKVTYSPVKVIKNASFYIALHDKSDLVTFYSGLFLAFRDSLKDFIDWDTCTFRFFSYSDSGSPSNSRCNNIDDFLNSFFETFSSFKENNQAYINDVTEVMKVSFHEDMTQDLSEDKVDMNYYFIYLSDMDFSTGQFDLDGNPKNDPLSESSYIVKYNGENITKNITYYGGEISSTGDLSSQGYSMFGDDVVLLPNYTGSFIYGFEFISLLRKVQGGELSIDDLFSSDEFVSGRMLKNQCNLLIEENALVSNTSRDYDKDGKITLIDRIYSICKNYYQGESDTSFLLNNKINEMDYWRKMCPIGQLYEFQGRITNMMRMSGDNYLLQVQVVKLVEGEYVDVVYDTEEDGSDKNIIYVYYEYGSASNVSGSDTISGGEIFDFRGRLFFPRYLLGKNDTEGITIGQGRNLNDPQELVAWYRVNLYTAEDMINYLGKDTNFYNQYPIVVVRSNVDNTVSPQYAHGSGPISNMFEHKTSVSQYFSICQIAENVDDHIVMIRNASNEYENTDEGIVISQIGRDNAVLAYESGTGYGVSFDSIMFDIEVAESKEVYKEFEYEILYQPENDSNKYQLDKFWSAAAFSSGSTSSQVKLKVSIPHTFVPKISWEENDNNINRLFDIVYPYAPHESDAEGKRFFFKWDTDSWDIKLRKNNKIVDYTIVDAIDVNAEISANAYISPSQGQILFKDEIDTTKESIILSFTNKAANQTMLKTGNKIWISLVSSPSTGFTEFPVIKSFRVNMKNGVSVERVDLNFEHSNTNTDNDHFIAPAWAFATVSGRSWSFNVDDSNSTADGAYSSRISGFLQSPMWYFDAFTDDVGDKTITASSSRYLAAINRVYSNLVDTNVQPYAEISSVGYIAPPSTILPRIATLYSRRMRHFLIVENQGKYLSQKRSYTEFLDRDTDPGIPEGRRSYRESIPVYSGIETIEDLTVEQIDVGVELDIVRSGKLLTGIKITSEMNTDDNDIVQPFSLYGQVNGSFVELGYETFDKTKSSLWIPVVNTTSDVAMGFSQLPNVVDIPKIRIVKPDEYADVGIINKVEGFYIDDYVSGKYPTLIETSGGSYILIFGDIDDNNKAIYGLMSTDKGAHWSRPASDESDESYGTPIKLLTGYSSPIVVEDYSMFRFNLFVYNNSTMTIDMATLPYSAFLKLNRGIDEKSTRQTNVEEGKTVENPEKDNESVSDILGYYDADSWQDIYGEGRSIFPVVYEATEMFSASMAKSGCLFVASLSTQDTLRLLFTSDSGANDFVGNDWVDVGVDILHEDSYLGKEIKQEDIGAITLSYNQIARIFYLFIATKDHRLLMTELPEVIARFELSKEDEAFSIDIQNLVNQKKPVLAIGDVTESSENVSADSYLREKFESQMVSVEWMDSGVCIVVYTKDGRVKAARSDSHGGSWEEYKNI